MDINRRNLNDVASINSLVDGNYGLIMDGKAEEQFNRVPITREEIITIICIYVSSKRGMGLEQCACNCNYIDEPSWHFI